MRRYQISVAGLLRGSGKRQTFEIVGTLSELFVTSSRVTPEEPIAVAGDVEAVGEGLLVDVRISTRFEGECVRCLEPVSGKLDLEARELFREGETSDEAYGFTGEVVDLSELIRDQVVMALPAVPLCRPECLGLCQHCGKNLNLGACGCDSDLGDLRWAGLDKLDS